MLTKLLEILSRCWQILIHHQLDEEAEVLVPVETDPRETIVQY